MDGGEDAPTVKNAMNYKIYTDKTHPANPIIKALMKKGYSDIVLSWQNALSRAPGWTVQADKQWLLRSYGRLETLKKVKALPDKKAGQQG